MSIVPMEKLAIDAITAPKPPRQFGKAQFVTLEHPTVPSGSNLKIVTPKLSQQFTIVPMGEKLEDDKFSLQCRVGEDAAAFKEALTAFDMRIRALAFANKKTWFGKNADDLTEERDLRTLQTMNVKKGNEKTDGSRWDDSVKFKVTGWAEFVEEVLYRDGSDMPKDVKWKARLVDTNGNGGPGPRQTQFFLNQGPNMVTGKDRMVPKVPVQDPAGNPKKDSNGNPLWEFVGPKHCTPGCQLTVVFEPSPWLAGGKFGVTLQARQIFITPPAAKPKEVIEGIEIVDTVDPILAGKAVQQALAGDDLRDLDAPDGAEDGPESAELATGPAALASSLDDLASAAVAAGGSGGGEAGKKRKAADAGLASPAGAGAPAKKSSSSSKAKKVTVVEEDF